MATKRRSHSSVSQQPDEVQAEVNRLIREGWTIDGIRGELAKLGAFVSRSAMGRYVKSAHESMEEYVKAQEISKIWVEKLGAEPNGDVGRLLTQTLQVLALRTVGDLKDAEEPAKPMDVMLLAKAIKDLSGTTKDAFAIDKARAEARAQARAELLAEQKTKLDQAEKVAGSTELTRARVREVLGIS